MILISFQTILVTHEVHTIENFDELPLRRTLSLRIATSSFQGHTLEVLDESLFLQAKLVVRVCESALNAATRLTLILTVVAMGRAQEHGGLL